MNRTTLIVLGAVGVSAGAAVLLLTRDSDAGSRPDISAERPALERPTASPTSIPGEISTPLPVGPRLTLPVVEGVQPFDEKNAIEVAVFRKPETSHLAPDTRGGNADRDAWQLGLKEETYVFSEDSLRRFAQEMETLGMSKSRTSHPRVSDRPILLRADAEAPVEIVKEVLDMAVWAGKTNRIFFAAMAGAQGPTGATAFPLPEDVHGGSYLELRVDLLWDSGASVLRRTVGPTKRQLRATDPVVDPRRVWIPLGREGDAELQDLLRRRHGELKAIRVREDDNALDLYIATSPRLSWQHVVRFVHLSRPTGPWRITLFE